jgi:hypothetical protein
MKRRPDQGAEPIGSAQAEAPAVEAPPSTTPTTANTKPEVLDAWSSKEIEADRKPPRSS